MSRSKLRRYYRHGLLPQTVRLRGRRAPAQRQRAAEELCLAQPTVSMQLKRLADTLEVRLCSSSAAGSFI
jgi:DNA-binding transcriptional LysR family regulator